MGAQRLLVGPSIRSLCGVVGEAGGGFRGEELVGMEGHVLDPTSAVDLPLLLAARVVGRTILASMLSVLKTVLVMQHIRRFPSSSP